MSTTARVLCAGTGAVIAFAGANKVTDRRAWMRAAEAQQLWSPVAVVVPWLELVLGVCLVVLAPNAAVMGAAAVLLVIFTVFLAVQIAAGSTVPCACFGARTARPPRRIDLVRNLAMIASLTAAAALS